MNSMQTTVGIPALKRAGADFTIMTVVVPMILGVWAGIPELKDFVNGLKEMEQNSLKQAPPKELEHFQFLVIVVLAGVGYVALFLAKITMASPLFHLALTLGSICKWMILLSITGGVQTWSDIAIYTLCSLLVTIFNTVLEQVETGFMRSGGRLIDLMSNLIGKLFQIVEGHGAEFEGSEEAISPDNIKVLTMQFYFSNLLQIMKEGASFMHWFALLLFGYGNLVKIFQNSPRMRVFVIVYACIGCLSFNVARLCRNISYGFLCLACLGSWMQMTIWGTVLVNFHKDSSYIPVLVASFVLTFPPIVLKFQAIDKKN